MEKFSKETRKKDLEAVVSLGGSVTIQKPDFKGLLSDALKALCLTRDFVGGDDVLPAIDGWEWYEAGKKFSDVIPSDEWAGEFRKRVNFYKARNVHELFKDGDWVFGISEHIGCSQVFTGTYGDFQPFSYLDDFDPDNFRIATDEEIKAAKL